MLYHIYNDNTAALYLFNILNTFNDVVAFHRLLDSIGVTQNPQVLLQRLLNETGRQGGEVSQLPQHLQHLNRHTQKHSTSDSGSYMITVT